MDRVRFGGVGDLDILVSHRRLMFEDMGLGAEVELTRMSLQFRDWVKPRIESESYISWLVEDGDGAIVAGAGVWLMDWPPHMLGVNPTRAYVLDVYTRPDRRREGLARRLMDEVLSWCSENRIPVVVLHASDQGRALYERLGFRETNEMRLILK